MAAVGGFLGMASITDARITQLAEEILRRHQPPLLGDAVQLVRSALLWPDTAATSRRIRRCVIAAVSRSVAQSRLAIRGQLEGMRVVELKEVLSRLGLSKGGNKTSLLTRIGSVMGSPSTWHTISRVHADAAAAIGGGGKRARVGGGAGAIMVVDQDRACVCGRGQIDNKVVHCVVCDEWYHAECVTVGRARDPRCVQASPRYGWACVRCRAATVNPFEKTVRLLAEPRTIKEAGSGSPTRTFTLSVAEVQEVRARTNAGPDGGGGGDICFDT